MNLVWLRRNFKKYVFVTVFLLVIAMLITLEYLDETTSRQMILRKAGVTSMQLDTIRNPSKTNKHSAHSYTSNSFIRNITPKPNLKSLINATRTKYPITIEAPYLLHNPSLCTSVQNLSVLVIVHSAPDHFERRNAMRDTWTNDSLYKHLGTVRVLFLLGRVSSPKLQQDIEVEFKTYKDLLQGDFIDAYRNLTHKGVMGYKWISEHCKNVKIVLKVDDDVVVDMFRFFTDYYPKYVVKPKQILCNHIHPGTMLIIRDKKSKWHVDEDHFKGQKYYPRYCSGFMVMITNDVIPAIFRSSSLTPFFWVDDVYLYGLAPGNVPGIQYTGLKKGDHQLNGQLALKCYRNESRTCNFFVAGAGRREVMVEVWSNMANLYQKAQQAAKSAPKRETTTKRILSTESESEFWNRSITIKHLAKELSVIDKMVDEKKLVIDKVANELENMKHKS